jgi:hypothetical protein
MILKSVQYSAMICAEGNIPNTITEAIPDEARFIVNRIWHFVWRIKVQNDAMVIVEAW